MTHSLYYSGDTPINDTVSASTIQNLIDNIKNKLLTINWTLTATTSEFGSTTGYKLKSKTDPSGYAVEVYLSYTGFGGNSIFVYVRDYPQTLPGYSHVLQMFGGSYRIIANSYQFFIFKNYSSDDFVAGGLLAGTGGPRCIWGMGNRTTDGSTSNTFLHTIDCPNNSEFFSTDSTYEIGTNTTGNGINRITLLTLRSTELRATDPDSVRGNQFVNGTFPVIQPMMCYGDKVNTNMRFRGRIYDAFVGCSQWPGGTIKTHDNAQFECITNNYKLGSLWLMIGPRAVQGHPGHSY